jgi:histidyl-tRNA synthetase
MDYLTAMGIDYKINPFIVRGLDYYTKTVFEFISGKIGAQGTICGGGRYDGLSEQLGGPENLCGIGFGIGMTRLLMEMEAEKAYFPEAAAPDIYIAPLTDSGDTLKIKETVITMLKNLRDNGIFAETDTMDRSLKSQMKYADKTGAKYTYVIGDREIAEKKAVLKNMRTAEQTECAFDELLRVLLKEAQK